LVSIKPPDGRDVAGAAPELETTLASPAGEGWTFGPVDGVFLGGRKGLKK